MAIRRARDEFIENDVRMDLEMQSSSQIFTSDVGKSNEDKDCSLNFPLTTKSVTARIKVCLHFSHKLNLTIREIF